MKTQTPYQRLLSATRKFYASAKNQIRMTFWSYSSDEITASQIWTLLHAKTQTSSALGYDVRLVVDGEMLRFEYVQRPADIGYFIG